MRSLIIYCIGLTALLSGCKDPATENGNSGQANSDDVEQFRIEFDQDSAYYYVKKQVDFGPRVPGTVAHGATANYLLNTLKRFCDEAMIQEGQMNSVQSKTVPIRNVIGIINPEKNKRVLLCAHWDTRPMADEDKEDPTTPADGANDGASGVGVLLEVARQFSLNRPDIGVDIVLFDAEDMGESEHGLESWCLGSQYWSHHPHKPDYTANYGILLDMVGPKNAVFGMEGHSLVHAKTIVEKVWRAGRSLGYGNHFIMFRGGLITDDHYFINTIIKIPTIDIIHYDATSGSGFGDFWHTHKDNMSSIEAETLRAVGETLLTVLYKE